MPSKASSDAVDAVVENCANGRIVEEFLKAPGLGQERLHLVVVRINEESIEFVVGHVGKRAGRVGTRKKISECAVRPVMVR